jgi:hypothetical protein
MKKTVLLITGIVSLYAFTVKAQVETDTFYFTGSTEIFVVDSCTGPISFDVRGGKGGDLTSCSTGGLGGRVEAIMTFNAGDTLYINVGQAGLNDQADTTGVFGGSGGVFSWGGGGHSGTGGGASDIRLNDTSLAGRIIIAGGGGGGGGNSIGPGSNGGAGGGLIGTDGIAYTGWPDAGGKGGTDTAGGTGGIACCSCPTYTTDGSLGIGGKGSGDAAGGGGGGGGYYGGGGACFSGGGGGSSYTDTTATSVVHTQGYQEGDGMIILSYYNNTYYLPMQTIGDCDSLISPSGKYVWTASGTYADTLKNVSGCDSILIISLTVTSIDTSVTLAASTFRSNENEADYQWLDCDNEYAVISDETSQSFTPAASGNYAVGIAKNGCTDTSMCHTITITTEIIENSFTGEFTLYPNPTDGNINIVSGENLQDIQIHVTDLNGKQIKHRDYTANKNIVLEIEGGKGIYFVEIISEQKRAVIKVVKR